MFWSTCTLQIKIQLIIKNTNPLPRIYQANEKIVFSFTTILQNRKMKQNERFFSLRFNLTSSFYQQFNNYKTKVCTRDVQIWMQAASYWYTSKKDNMAPDLKKNTVYLSSYSPLNKGYPSILTNSMFRTYNRDIHERIIL